MCAYLPVIEIIFEPSKNISSLPRDSGRSSTSYCFVFGWTGNCSSLVTLISLKCFCHITSMISEFKLHPQCRSNTSVYLNSKHAFTCFMLVHIISPKHRSTLNAHNNDFECRHIEHMMPHKQGIPSRIIVRGEGGATPFSHTCWRTNFLFSCWVYT